MLTETQIQKVKELLKDLCHDSYDCFYASDYGDTIYHSVDSEDYTDWCYVEANHRCTIRAGLTKLVIEFGDFPYVIKIPFHGIYSPDEEIITTEFDDHCEIEANIYKTLDEKIKQLFLPIEFEFQIGNIKVYSQPYADETYDDFIFNFSEENEDYLDYESIYTLNRMEQRIVERYGNKFVESIASNYCCGDYHEGVQMMSTIAANVMDLHKENYGFKNDKPVIFDYAGISESNNVVRVPF